MNILCNTMNTIAILKHTYSSCFPHRTLKEGNVSSLSLVTIDVNANYNQFILHVL